MASSSSSTSHIAPIKLKLSLGGAAGGNAPSTPTPTTALNGKGKGRDVDGTANGDTAQHEASSSTAPPILRLKPPADVDTAGDHVAGPSTALTGTPSGAGQHHAISSAPVTPRGRPKKGSAASTTKGKHGKGKGKAARGRLSAIPPHLTPRSSFSTPLPSYADVPVEGFGGDDADPISLPMSPSDMDVTMTPSGGTEDGYGDEMGIGSARKGTAKWQRLRKPFRELATKVLQELRRRDEYGLFLEPVDTEEYPDYLDRVGGEDKMMDLATMQRKVDEREYRDFEQFEADLNMLVEAAHTYNLPGTVPHTAATKILQYGLKHIGRSRPLVRTPSPSPTRDSRASDTGTPGRGRELTSFTDDMASARRLAETQPLSYIPDEMLAFPPNSLQALAVGWNLNGGRRVRARKQLRGREKFAGKWREYDVDGARDVAEMDEPDDVLAAWRQRPGDAWRTVTDWKGLRKDGAWWDWDGPGGPTGQPPLPGAPKARREPLRTRELGVFEWGVYPEVEAELSLLKHRVGLMQSQASQAAHAGPAGSASQAGQASQAAAPIDELDILAEHVRPDYPRAPRFPPNWPAQQFQNIWARRPAGEWLRDVVIGGPAGEAYVRSAEGFVHGAARSAGLDDEDARALHDLVARRHRGGVLDDADARAARAGLAELDTLADPAAAKRLGLAPGSAASGATSGVAATARAAYARAALAHLDSAASPLDILPLLRRPDDFGHAGIAGRPGGVSLALDWIGRELAKCVTAPPSEDTTMDGGMRDGGADSVDTAAATHATVAAADSLKRPRHPAGDVDASEPALRPTKVAKTAGATSGGSSPLSDAPGDEAAGAAANDDDEAQHLRTIRLELVALAKFYPLAALRKMDKADADRLLPSNVRALMTRQ